tara:strand:- start:353 stop:565 length:213 start_codon:yes stop_codon:yes gene_type:complete
MPKEVVLFQLNMLYSLDDAGGWKTVGAYSLYPSKDEAEDKMQKHLGRVIANPVCDEHHRFVAVPYYPDYT